VSGQSTDETEYKKIILNPTDEQLGKLREHYDLPENPTESEIKEVVLRAISDVLAAKGGGRDE